MKCQIVGPVLGKLVHQLHGVANWSYYLRLTRMIAHWKDLSEEYDGKGEKSLVVDFPKNIV